MLAFGIENHERVLSAGCPLVSPNSHSVCANYSVSHYVLPKLPAMIRSSNDPRKLMFREFLLQSSEVDMPRPRM